MTQAATDHETATYAYACSNCGVTTLLSYRGGNLNCTCDPPAPANQVHLTVIHTDGEHDYRGTIAQITGTE